MTDATVDPAGTEAGVVAALAQAAAKAQSVHDLDDGDVLVHVVPENHRVTTTDLEQYGDAPRRTRGKVHPATVDDLINYVQRHSYEATSVWVHPTNGRVEAVVDDHSPVDGPGFGEHRAILDLLVTPEWKHWIDNDCRSFNQTEFAEFIEDGAREITLPTAADMLELAQSFQAASSATFRSKKMLADGTVQMQYDETVTATATAGKTGQLEVPSEFKLAIRPFVGEPAYALTARLRFRVGGGNLALSYKLDRPDDVVRDALDGVAKRLSGEFDNVYVGTPRL